jgi:hypothetical protein
MLGLEWANVCRELRTKTTAAIRHDEVATYDYVDENGGLCFQVVRNPGKRFQQRRPDGRGGWIWNLKGVRPLLYRLPEILEAVALEKRVYVVEGEKDADRLWSYGLAATTNGGGAGKWRSSHTERLKGARVVILPDNDDVGRKHAKQVVASLRGSAESSCIVELPDLPTKGDVSDWLDAGNTIERLQELTEAAAPSEQLSLISASTIDRMMLIDDEALLSLKDPSWLNEGRIPSAATAQLFGESGAYKSFVALDLSAHIALGMDWHGRRVIQGNVVYVCAEGVVGMKKRVAAWKQYHGIAGRLGIYFLKHGLALRHDSVDVQQLLAEIGVRVTPPPVLIVIDTLARNLVGNENAAEDMSGYVKGCDLLRTATGATVLSIHHSGYGETERGRGSSSNRAAMDTDIQCLRDGDRVMLRNRKQKDAAEFADISFETFAVGDSLVLEPMDQLGGKLDGNRLLCLQAIHRLDGGAKHSQWMKEAGLEQKRSSFNAARAWLQATAYVKRDGAGNYAITEAGILALGPRSTCSPQLVHPAELDEGPSRGVLIEPALDLDSTPARGTEVE